MKLKTVIFLSLPLFAFTSCKTHQYRNAEISLNVAFQPAFIDFAEVTLTNDSLEVKLAGSKYEPYMYISKERVKISAADVDSITAFLQNFRFTIEKNDKFQPPGQFQKTIVDGNSVELETASFGHDGIGVEGVYIKNGAKKRFMFWSPNTGDPKNDLALKLVRTMQRNFKTPAMLVYSKELEEYFVN